MIIIAEAGVNHNGKIKLAKKLVDVAKNAGADYVKFQSFSHEKLVIKKASKAKYQKNNSKPKKDYYGLLELKNKEATQAEVKKAYRNMAMVSKLSL